MVTKFPSLMKNEQAILVVYGVKRRPKSKTNVEANSLAIVKRMNDKEILTLKVPYLVKEDWMKKMWLYHRWMGLEWKELKEVLTVKDLVHMSK